jgi:iron complex transport system permease protein
VLALGLAIGAAALVAVLALSLAVGARPTEWSSVGAALRDYDPGLDDHVVIRDLRVPRTLVGLLAGIGLGVAGAVMQGITRNPLADPGLLGVNAGAALAVVVAIHVFGVASLSGYVWFAFAGAALASLAVYLLGATGRDRTNPVKLAPAGRHDHARPVPVLGRGVARWSGPRHGDSGGTVHRRRGSARCCNCTVARRAGVGR